ncbi:MAG: electron transporter RnfD, partial [Clostridiales bacterium]|nr:electron transporter RnfD [Clostridiales bacterium]
MKSVLLSDPRVQYCGRIDRTVPEAPLFTWVCSSFRFILKGKRAVLRVRNDRSYYQNSLGIVMNGFEGRIPLKEGEQQIDISAFLIDEVNDVLIYKRQDGCHRFALLGLEIEGELQEVPPLPSRRIEVYGDSVSCGELCEAMHLTGQN